MTERTIGVLTKAAAVSSAQKKKKTLAVVPDEKKDIVVVVEENLRMGRRADSHSHPLRFILHPRPRPAGPELHNTCMCPGLAQAQAQKRQ